MQFSVFKWVAVAGAASAALIGAARAQVSFNLTTGSGGAQSLVIDSNKCPAQGPVAMYVAGEVTNNGATTATDVTLTISGLSGAFALTGTQTAALDIGSLAAGDSMLAGWHITYPCTDGALSNVTITTTSSAGGDVDPVAMTVRFSQSAAAGGNVASTVLGPGAVVGQLITADVTYDFGNINAGNEFFIQPAGNTGFDARCLRLVGSEVLSSNVTAASVGSVNQMYFVSPVKQAGNGYFITARFFYRYRCAGTSTIARPYAVQTSGGANIKYTGNYDGSGSLNFTFPPSTNPFTIAKTASTQYLLSGAGPHVVNYTVTVSNPSAFESLIDGLEDVLPTGVSYNALATGGVTAGNSSALPASGDTGTLSFTGNAGSSYIVPAGGSLTLAYSVNVQDVSGSYINSATALIGDEVIGPAAATVTVSSPSLMTMKTVSVYDPSAAGLFATPGNDVAYTLTLSNTGAFSVDADSLVLVDPLPAEIEFYNGDFDGAGPGAGAFEFLPGASAVTCCAAGDVEYSNSASAPAVYGYSPAAGYDANVRFVRLTPKGALDPGETISIRFRARIK